MVYITDDAVDSDDGDDQALDGEEGDERAGGDVGDAGTVDAGEVALAEGAKSEAKSMVITEFHGIQ